MSRHLPPSLLLTTVLVAAGTPALGQSGAQPNTASPGEPAMTRFVATQLSTSHWYDITAARRDLGYEPAVSVEEGLRRLAASFGGAK